MTTHVRDPRELTYPIWEESDGELRAINADYDRLCRVALEQIAMVTQTLWRDTPEMESAALDETLADDRRVLALVALMSNSAVFGLNFNRPHRMIWNEEPFKSLAGQAVTLDEWLAGQEGSE